MSDYALGQTYRRCDVGLAGKHGVVWLKCETCGVPRFTCARKPTALCRSCTSKKMRRDFSLNDAAHKPDCKCYRCRIGRGYFVGPNNPGWRSGRIELSAGYVAVWVSPDDPMHAMTWSQNGRKNYCLEHRLVMARHLGRPLAKSETVHHKNGVKNDNRLSNLELWTRPHPAGVRVIDMEDEA